MNKVLISIAMVVAAASALLYAADRAHETTPLADTDSLRHTATGDLLGFADAYDTHGWMGIPFAEPAVGELRWRAPQPAAPWSDTREALTLGSPCVQYWNVTAGIKVGESGQVVGSEDCLYLNVWAPRFSPDAIPTGDKRLPVMFWIHGGGNTAGTANTYKGHHLAGSQDVIVIAINYRLGPLGWFSHPALRNTADNALDASGNFGLLDMISGLEWVRDNISEFGGDPDNVTIFGESSGAHDVFALLVSPSAKGLFHRAISQSGSINTLERRWAENYMDDVEPGEPNSSREVIAKLLQADGIASERKQAKEMIATMSDQDISRYLRSKSVEQMLSAYRDENMLGMYRAPQNFRDGTLLPTKSIFELLAQPQHYNSVPLMLGTTRDEQKIFMADDPRFVDKFLGIFPRAKDSTSYNREAAYLSDQWKAMAVDEPAKVISATKGNPVYAYRFDWDEGPKNWWGDFSELIGAGHALELDFIFGDFNEGLTEGVGLGLIYNEENQAGREQLSSAMMSYWAQFAYTGNPARGRNNNLPEWSAWGSSQGDFIVLDTEADGGLRMSNKGISVQALKERLLADSTVANQEDLCRRYVSLFFMTWPSSADFWDEEEYANWGEQGCRQYPPYDPADFYRY